MEVDDWTLRGMVAKCLDSWSEIGVDGRKEGAWRVIETAGGVASPGPSGTLQCDLYRFVFCYIPFNSLLFNFFLFYFCSVLIIFFTLSGSCTMNLKLIISSLFWYPMSI